VGFDDHKQEVFNLLQSLKMLFLYPQGKKEMVEEYARNLRSLWDTVEAFEGLPGVHKGLVEGLIRTPGQVADPNNVIEDELAAVVAEVSEAVKGGSVDQRRRQKALRKIKGRTCRQLPTGQLSVS
jgi:hypothetical protein